MNCRKDNKIIITMSPEDLRRLADEMEERWNELRPGDSTFVDIIGYLEDKTRICLHLDQEYFHKKFRNDLHEKLHGKMR
jgi:hypothetical protein